MDTFTSVDLTAKNPHSDLAMNLAQAKAGETFFVFSGQGLFARLLYPEFYYKNHYFWRPFSERSWRYNRQVKKKGIDSLPLFTFTSEVRIEITFTTLFDGEVLALPSVRADTTLGTLSLVDCGLCPDPISGLWNPYNIPGFVTKERLLELEDWLRWWRRRPDGWPYVEAIDVLLGDRPSKPCPF